MRSRLLRAGFGLGFVLLFGSCHHATNGAPDSPRSGTRASPAPLAMGGEDERAEEPYLSLTTSDGTGLSLVEMNARAVLDEPLALTEIRLTFANPEDRTLEGRFHVVLPPGAALSRLAMKIDDQWQEGEIVEKQTARAAYEDALHFKRDPALLEQAAGNEYTVRVFPIPARANKEILLSYSQELANAPYALPLKGLPSVGRLHVEATRAGQSKPAQTLDLASAAPTADFVIEGAASKGASALRAGDLVVARVTPVTATEKDPIARAVVLVDTSASRALGLRESVRALDDLAARLDGARFVVACFDQEVEPIYDGEAARLDVSEKILARGALGASDLSRALGWAKNAAKASGATRVIVLTDGVATAGEGADAIVRAAKDLRAAGVERLDAIAIGGIRDDATLKRLTTAGLARDGVVVDAARPSAEIARRLSETTRSNVALNMPGATWMYPARVDGVQAGDEVVVYAELPKEAPFALAIGSAPAASFAPRTAERPLVERALAQAKIASLVDAMARGANKGETRAKIVDLSVTNRVVSPYTALVVLETEEDYARFGLARRGLADVLAVDGGRVVRRKRAMPKLPPKAPQAVGNMWGNGIGDAFGAGGLGLSGAADPNAPVSPWGREEQEFGMIGLLNTGEGGGGRGEGIGLGAIGTIGHGAGASGQHATRGPAMRQGSVQVNGRLPPEVIQRIVRQNFGRFRLCYETGLRANPQLRGRVAVRFTIGRDGSVVEARDGGSDLPDANVVSCVARAFMSLAFPQPEAASVTVVYPITFESDGTRPPGPTPPAVWQPSAAPEREEPYEGKLKEVMDDLARGATNEGLAKALRWRKESPGDVLALVGLGEALESARDLRTAARAYGSIVDLFPGRADLRRYAGARLERLELPAALDLAADTFAKAEEDRPDHPSSHRMLAFARLKKGDYAGAFAAISRGVRQAYPAGRFAGVDRILREDAGIIAEAWTAAEPKREREIGALAAGLGVGVDREPSLRFVLTWETDANDVDFHIFDAAGGHAFYGSRMLMSGGELYADVTTGYGPECFGIRGPKEKRRGPYHLQAHYYAKGPMGYGMGKLEIVEHDGKGHLTFDERPFVVMTDRAFVDLGEK